MMQEQKVNFEQLSTIKDFSNKDKLEYVKSITQEYRIGEREILIYGAGKNGQAWCRMCEAWGIKVLGVVDGDVKKHGKTLEKHIIHPLDYYVSAINEGAQILISLHLGECEVQSQIRDLVENPDFLNISIAGIYMEMALYCTTELMNIYRMLEDDASRKIFEYYFNAMLNKITSFTEICSTDQYFPKDVITLGKDEVFIDAGSLYGDTFYNFYNRTAGVFKKIYCFEPSDKTFSLLEQTVGEYSIHTRLEEQVVLLNKGLGEKAERRLFDGEMVAGSTRFVEEFSHEKYNPFERYISVDVVRLDDITDDATFIKMDVEGAELSALKGAEHNIRKNKPKLAISLYHKPEDLIEIPLFIKNLGLDYKYYIRHHAQNVSELILYAV